MKKIIFTLALLLVVGMGFSQRPEMVFIEGGSYYMGNDYSGALDEKPEHKVTLGDFYMSKYEVTFEMFDNFSRSTGFVNADDGQYGRGKNPAINISWEGAIKYCNWLSSRFGYEKVYDLKIDSSGMTIQGVNWDADGYRLPTEAEWEYVAKGGSKSQGFAYAGSNDPKEVAWFSDNSENKPHEVGSLKPNELGIYDILGNAWEWCWDYYDGGYYSKSPENDPRGADKGDNRTYRGGNFESKIEFIRITRRFSLSPTLSSGLVGIRLVQNGTAEQP
ncbi:MAG: SUMF1/EgtB/PvdO family nonheme iron enzyme [Bacteroidales bacterium]|nr:SUMF1/EgtB/PvdO family nonheme iron enzyme [Bacteroidales bacterium]